MEVIRRELQQPPCVPIYLPVFMLICSSFVLWLSMLLAKANLSPWALDLIASHLLKEIPTSYLINYFSSLLDHYYCLQICSYLSHIKIWSKNTFSSRYSPISHLPFIKKKNNLEVTVFTSLCPILSWTHSNQVSPNLSTKTVLLKVINALYVAQPKGYFQSSSIQPISITWHYWLFFLPWLLCFLHRNHTYLVFLLIPWPLLLFYPLSWFPTSSTCKHLDTQDSVHRSLLFSIYTFCLWATDTMHMLTDPNFHI